MGTRCTAMTPPNLKARLDVIAERVIQHKNFRCKCSGNCREVDDSEFLEASERYLPYLLAIARSADKLADAVDNIAEGFHRSVQDHSGCSCKVDAEAILETLSAFRAACSPATGTGSEGA